MVRVSMQAVSPAGERNSAWSGIQRMSAPDSPAVLPNIDAYCAIVRERLNRGLGQRSRHARAAIRAMAAKALLEIELQARRKS